MPTAREIMTPDALSCPDTATAEEAAQIMARNDIGAIPVCDASGHLSGVVTDRDLAVKVVAEGRDGATVQLGELVDGGEVVTIGADDDLDEAIRTMKAHSVRRLPVIDGSELVGMISQADIAGWMPDAKIGDLVGAISAAPPN